MSTTDSFNGMIGRLRDGDDHAAAETFNRFSQRLIALARKRLSGRMNRKLDADDVIQSVYRSFFTRLQDGQFRFDDWDGLWRLLVTITLRKCVNQVEYFQAARRDVRRESSTTGFQGPNLGNYSFAREPTPDEAAMLAETIEGLFSSRKQDERDILALQLEGYATAEISQTVARSERTVRRVVARAKTQLERANQQSVAKQAI